MEQDGLPAPRRYWSAATIVLTLFMAVLDSSIANVALPTIARELNTSAAGSIWVVNAYQLALVATLLPLASLGEILGYKRVYQAGLAVFTLASIACALADSLATLTLARILQGLGAAGIVSMNGALVRHTYPRAMLGRGISVNAVVIALAAALGPTIASGILAVGSWQWLFAINAPLGFIAMAAAPYALPRPDPWPRRFDLLAAALNAMTFAPLVLGVEFLTRGDRGVLGWSGVAVGLICGALLFRRSLSQRQPLVPLDLLQVRVISLSVGTSVASFTAQMTAFVSLPFLLQYAYGRSAVETGVLMTPWPLAVAVVAPMAGRLSDRMSGGILGAVGLSVLAVGLILLGLLPTHPSAFDIGWRMAVCGAGFGLFQSPNNRTIMGWAPKDRLGSAGGLIGTARLTGQTVGASLAAFLFHISPKAQGSTAPLFVGAAFALFAAGVSALKIKEPRPTEVEPTPEALTGD